MKEELINEFDIEHKENVAYSQAYVDNLQSQLKAKEEVIKEAREYIKEHTDLEPYNEDGEGGGLILCDYDVANVLEILSKGENK